MILASWHLKDWLIDSWGHFKHRISAQLYVKRWGRELECVSHWKNRQRERDVILLWETERERNRGRKKNKMKESREEVIGKWDQKRQREKEKKKECLSDRKNDRRKKETEVREKEKEREIRIMSMSEIKFWNNDIKIFISKRTTPGSVKQRFSYSRSGKRFRLYWNLLRLLGIIFADLLEPVQKLSTSQR